jgi:hypothetical protein
VAINSHSADASKLYLATGNQEAIVLLTKKPCDTLECIVTQMMGAGTKARPECELVTLVSGFKPDKLPSKLFLHCENLQGLVNC